MLAMGGTKGALLAMVVELLCCALTGAAFGFEADSFFTDEGNRPRLGQALLVVDPGALAGADAFADRIEAFVAAMQAEDGVRLPGSRRDALSARAAARGRRDPRRAAPPPARPRRRVTAPSRPRPPLRPRRRRRASSRAARRT